MSIAAPEPRVKWEKPERRKDGTGSQLSTCGGYVIRKTLTRERLMYWAWHEKRLLGYGPNVDALREACDAHYARAVSEASRA